MTVWAHCQRQVAFFFLCTVNSILNLTSSGFCEVWFGLDVCSFQIKEHIRKVHTKRSYPHACPLCFRRFEYVYYLRQHVEHVHSDDRNNVCQYCDAKFKYPGTLRGHVAMKHSKKLPFSCNSCGLKFLWECRLKRHKLKCHLKCLTE